MKILFLTPAVPFDLSDGGNAPTFELLRLLVMDHEVHLVTFIEREEDLKHVQQWRQLCASVQYLYLRIHLRAYRLAYPAMLIKAFFSPLPYRIKKFTSSAMKTLVHTLLSEHTYDVIIAEHVWMYHFIANIDSAIKIIHTHNYETNILKRYLRSTLNPFRRAYALIDKLKMATYERRVYCDADRVWVLSDDDRRGIACLTKGRAQLESLHFTIDIKYWKPSEEPYDPTMITFIGTMSYPPNVDGALWFCRRIFPVILQNISDAKLYLVGMTPHAKVQRLSNNGNIVVTGDVDDVRPYLRKSAVSVLPLTYGGGVKTKAVISLSMGVPVVTTSAGSEGIPALNGIDLIIEDNPSKFAHAVVRVMTDRELRNRLSFRSRRFAERHYSRHNLVAEVDRSLRSICDRTN
jgi:polysaccharide biosynthesis protein PslH